MLLTAVVTVSRPGDTEQWRLAFSFEEPDVSHVAEGAPAESLEWFTLMFRVNVAEWWHTRKLKPNMRTAYRVG
ncbi:hypothetical protein SCATT_42770 [Streptantibioticus cattleyicolor NRRL 8057 = DSM 46488]|uniref:Uncharacterized protein n=1 Tax=Streptantibioticus cattleyicolor (strain ATCC 35852 / DSM 46488 / JCM 4925 / NBRC 14057 / NRRL 8057) TaxID=1003195 RepID=G8WSU2_STREN|nr:hypothetical protein SCATT_42770 [Streptantibioticus cattleyicolor NRRL 8057 = DSM 46488]